MPFQVVAHPQTGCTEDGHPHTVLQLRAGDETHVISGMMDTGLSLREKVSVMRHINLHLAHLQDGGESGWEAAQEDTRLLAQP